MDYLGKPYNDSLSPYAQVESLGINWSIWKQELFYIHDASKHLVEDRSVLVRSDTGECLGITSNSFEPSSPMKLINLVKSKFPLCTIVRVGQIYNGRRFWVLVEIPKSRVKIKDEVFQGYLLLGSSCDGTLKEGYRYIVMHVQTNVIVYNRPLIAIELDNINQDLLYGMFTLPSAKLRHFVNLPLSGVESFIKSFLVQHEVVLRRDVTDSKQYKEILNLYKFQGQSTWWSVIWAICRYFTISTKYQSEDNKMNSLLFGRAASIIRKLLV